MIESFCWKEGTKRCVCMIHSAMVVATAVPIAAVHVCNFCAPSDLWSELALLECAVQPDQRDLLDLQGLQVKLVLQDPLALPDLRAQLAPLALPDPRVHQAEAA